MMKKLYLVILLLIVVEAFAKDKGHLLIIGGGSIPNYLIEKYIELAGGVEAKIIIVPMASGEPQISARSFSKRLTEAGCTNIETIFCSKETADSDSNLSKIKGAKAIYFTGGDQSKLIKAILGTSLLQEIRNIYLSGGVIGGTSAGAAVMSKIMLTGNELINQDSTNTYNVIKKGNIETAEGFAFLPCAIVDQHFIKRKRMHRLISVVLENPRLIGIGIDESTGIVIKPNNSFYVIGESLVTVLDATQSRLIDTDKNKNQSARDVKLHLLKSGDYYAFPSHKKSKGNNR